MKDKKNVNESKLTSNKTQAIIFDLSPWPQYISLILQ